MTPSPKSSSEQQAIQSQVDRFVAAWNNHDTKAMASFYAEDADLINPFGRVARSRSEIEELFRDEQSTTLKGTRFSSTTERIRMFAPDIAVGDYAFEITGGTTQERPMRGHLTMVFQRRANNWEVAVCRPMFPVPQP